MTTSSDGFARAWDIREACLKRYGAVVGKRPEYRLRLTEKEKKAEKQSESTLGRPTESRSETLLPPLPVRENAAASPAARAPNAQQPANASGPSPGRLVVPPLPAAVPPLPGAGAAQPAQNGNAAQGGNGNANENIVPGQFVFNDEINIYGFFFALFFG